MDQLALKLLFIGLMFLLSVLFGLLPLKLLQFLRKHAALTSEFEEGKRWPSLLLCLMTCFSGGVFLATCFLHLLPEVTEQMQEIIHKYSWPHAYPMAELISCAGFFLVFLIEELVILCLHHVHGEGGHRHHSNSVVHVHVVQTPSSPTTKAATITAARLSSKSVARRTVSVRGTVAADDGLNDRAELQALTDTNSGVVSGWTNKRENGSNMVRDGLNLDLRTPTSFPLLEPCDDLSPSMPTECIHYGDHVTIAVRQNGYVSNDAISITSCPSCHLGHENCPGIELPLNAEPECCEGPCDGRKENPPIMMAYRPHAHSHGVRSITLVVALSFHSIIEGLALGIQASTTATTALFLGIIIHKCIIIFSTGVQLARTHAHQLLLVVVTIVFVSLMSPIGAGVGVAVEHSWDQSITRDVTIMVFSGLSVGTFLYVTFFEVLIHERDNEHNNLWKLFAILAGFILMAGLRATDNEHSHGTNKDHQTNTTSMIVNNATSSWISTISV